MSDELKKEIENHLATFPDRHSDIVEMKKEWNDYKNKAGWIMISFIGSILAIGIWVGTMQTNIESISEHIKEDTEAFTKVEARVNSLEVNNGEIRARLSSIDLSLQEIKVAIKQLY